MPFLRDFLISSQQGTRESVGHLLFLGLERVFYKWIYDNIPDTQFEEGESDRGGE